MDWNRCVFCFYDKFNSNRGAGQNKRKSHKNCHNDYFLIFNAISVREDAVRLARFQQAKEHAMRCAWQRQRQQLKQSMPLRWHGQYTSTRCDADMYALFDATHLFIRAIEWDTFSHDFPFRLLALSISVCYNVSLVVCKHQLYNSTTTARATARAAAAATATKILSTFVRIRFVSLWFAWRRAGMFWFEPAAGDSFSLNVGKNVSVMLLRDRLE